MKFFNVKRRICRAKFSERNGRGESAALVRRPIAVFAGRPFGRRPHVLDALRLVPDFPVLDVPVVSVRPAAVVVPDGRGEDFGDLVEVFRYQRVEMHLLPGVLDRRPEAEEDFGPHLLASALQKVVGRSEDVVLRVLRVEMHQREDVEVVADALVGVYERPVVSTGVLEPQASPGISPARSRPSARRPGLRQQHS